MKTKTKVCKGCKKALPDGYEHKYCEACRTKHALTAKNALNGCLSVGLIAIAILSRGKIDFKK